MLKNLISNYKKRRREDVKTSSSTGNNNDDEGRGKAQKKGNNNTTENTNNDNDNIASVLFHCREGSVTHYYHFFFGALVPLIEYHLDNPTKVLRILTDVGPFKHILCELPLTISEIRGPNLARKGYYHDDKSLNQYKERGQISLKGYDCFNNEFFAISHFPKPPRQLVESINSFFNNSVPFYIQNLPVYDVILIERACDVYYQRGGCADRDTIYQTSGSERRSITNHMDLVDSIQTECNRAGLTFCNISLERTSVYYQYHMFSNAKIVIAQHGAALANVFFMAFGNGLKENEDEDKSCKVDSSSHCTRAVIEISPPWSRQFEHFKNLSSYFEVSHFSVLQEQDHSAVNIPEVIQHIKIVINE